MYLYRRSDRAILWLIVLFIIIPLKSQAAPGDGIPVSDSTSVSPDPSNGPASSLPSSTLQIVSKPSDTATLDKMVVKESRRQRLLEVSQALSIIKPDEWVGTTKGIADVIAEQTGVQTQRFGGTGSFQTVSLRGVQGSEVLVLLDGIPLNSAMGGAVDLGAISPDRLGEIEMYKGIIPPQFGGNSLGGVINLKSKTVLKTRSLSAHAAIGAYGYQKYHLEATSPFSTRCGMFSSLVTTRANNNWPYRDRNNTPYNLADDATRTVENHHYTFFEARIHPSFDLSDEQRLVGGAAYSAAEVGLPASEGSTNRTARHGQEMLTFTARLSNYTSSESSPLVLTPEAGYIRIKNNNFWTSLDSSMGTSHGTIALSPNSFGSITSDLHTVHATCIADFFISNYIGGQAVLSGRHSAITTASQVTGFPHGDWPGNAQEASLAGDLNGTLPLGWLHFGTTIGAGIKAIRSATDGGHNEALEMMVEPSDTFEFPWSAHGGLHIRRENLGTLFFNAARYSNIPGLREKYGTRGLVIPNPSLREENGIAVEGGARYMHEHFFAEVVAFRTRTHNGIVMLSDGNMTQPVNLAAGITTGLETTVWVQPCALFRTDVRLTLQHAENHARFNNYYGKKLPNEPDLSIFAKWVLGPFKGIELQYWLDYKSAFYRDFGNTKGQRVPDDPNAGGMIFHNGLLSCNTFNHLELSVSIRNFNQHSFRYEEMAYSVESGYSWILYPMNEWCISAGYTF